FLGCGFSCSFMKQHSCFCPCLFCCQQIEVTSSVHLSTYSGQSINSFVANVMKADPCKSLEGHMSTDCQLWRVM
uniref:Uncharacterized protein n=1 Tax=Prolemur simus TaxID=1328070 RepID=A0A8C8Z1G4_PROSS